MKKLLSLITMVMMIVSVMPVVLGVDIGQQIGIDITPEEFEPVIWMCDNRAVLDDTLEGGRATFAGKQLDERANNYAFEGEQIKWKVLAMDKNKIEQIKEVVATIGDSQGTRNDIEVECLKIDPLDGNEEKYGSQIPASCNARISEESLTGEDFDPLTQQFYECTLTVETPESMHGEFWITVEAISKDGRATIDENEFWFLNPTIAVSVDGDLKFKDVRPGTVSYSDTLLVGNDAEAGSGVLLDTFISGTDFYDSSSSDARCPVTNRLKLGDNNAEASDSKEAKASDLDDKCNINLGGTELNDHLCYYATQGAYSTQNDPRSDAEGYAPIVYGNQFTTDFYNDAEIIATPKLLTIGGVDYFAGNVLSPGSETAMTFKLGLPEPCVGDFDSGSLFFWGEAI